MSIPQMLRAAAIPVLLAVALPPAAAADGPPDRLAIADAVFEAATELEHGAAGVAFAERIRSASVLYLESASLREDADPRKVESLHRAGRLLHRVDARRSHRLLAEAAELALIQGHAARAAGAFLDAAAVIQEMRAPTNAERMASRRYLQTAQQLAEHPVVDADSRRALVRRIDPAAYAVVTS